MKKKSLIFGVLTLMLGFSATAAMACNCGKRNNFMNQPSSCQCSGSCGGQSACAEPGLQLVKNTEQPEAAAEEAKPVEVGNKICPVSGEKVGEMGDIIQHEYNGKIYNLCCNACAKDFKKDPEKYSKIADEEVAQSKMIEEEEGQDDHSGQDHQHHE